MRFIEYLDKAAEQFPNRKAMVFEDRSWTFREMQEITFKIADALIADGYREDSKCATWAPNHPMGFSCAYGIFRAGAIWVPINARNSVSENVALLNTLGVEIVFLHSSLGEVVRHIREGAPSVRQIICLDGGLDEVADLLDWIAQRPPANYHAKAGDGIVSMPTTSGTTALPKAIEMSNGNWEAFVANYQIVLKYTDPPVYLLAAPMTHAAGYFSMTVVPLGSTTVIMAQPDPLSILEAIEKYKVTTLFLPPTLIYMMLAHPRLRDFDYSSLRHMIYGGAPMSIEKLREAMHVFGPVMAQHYGQTEAPVVISFMTPHEHVEALRTPGLAGRLLSAGREGPLVRLAILDDDGKELPHGEVGEISVKGLMVSDRYYKNPQATAEVKTNGWHRTGDLGRKDDDGFVYLVDRKKDMIISGGFNVYPAEVEQVIWSHPAIQDCAVIGIPDEKWGEAVTAILELKPGSSIEPGEIIALCKERLGSVKAPKSALIWKELPRSAVGKVLKREIRARFWEGRDRII